MTRARSCTIVPNFVGSKFGVHNGKIYNEFTVTEDMVGHKLGEFSPWVSTWGGGRLEELGPRLMNGVVGRTRKKFQYKLSKNK